MACSFLAVNTDDMSTACCTKTMRVPGSRSSRGSPDGGQMIRTVVPIPKALANRDAVARQLYGGVFAFVVELVNLTVSFDKAAKSSGSCSAKDAGGKVKGLQPGELPYIGLLDIFGFEFFKVNSFEQLCINFTNELLQQYFNEVIFEHEANLYIREGIRWDPLDYPNNREIVDLISKTPTGVFPMLDEECLMVGGGAEKWCAKLLKHHGSCRHFSVVKHRSKNFVVGHFAGPVEYSLDAFLEKNREQLSTELTQCLQASANSVIRQHFEPPADVPQVRKISWNSRGYSVSLEFREQLRHLMERIRATEPHFIRCIKPNQKSMEGVFDRKAVVHQLSYQGVLEAIKVSRAGFPVRLRHRQAVMEHRCLLKGAAAMQLEALVLRGQFDVAARHLFTHLACANHGSFIPGMVGNAEVNCRVGNSLVFLKSKAVQALNGALAAVRRTGAIRIQTGWRGCMARVHYSRVQAAILRMQAACRGRLARVRCLHLRQSKAALRLQAAQRGSMARAWRRQKLLAIARIQSHTRCWLRKHWLERSIRNAGQIQRRSWQRYISRRAAHHWQAALCIQKRWRMHHAVCETRELRALTHRRRLAGRRLLVRYRSLVCDRISQMDIRSGAKVRLLFEASWLRLSEEVSSCAASAFVIDDGSDAQQCLVAQEVCMSAGAIEPLTKTVTATASTASSRQPEPAAPGELLSAAAALRGRMLSLRAEAADLQEQRDTLVRQLEELESFAMHSLVRRTALTALCLLTATRRLCGVCAHWSRERRGTPGGGRREDQVFPQWTAKSIVQQLLWSLFGHALAAHAGDCENRELNSLGSVQDMPAAGSPYNW
eukprot:NODE_80_length_3781_cov_7.921730.p1 GENE.NODE_80_length_3781_cov_7.921730~~NODE_80_length_3781_cov_7.921730.p1  ORF type:complete len:829 (+),score=136.25 NODE_80_length_3781_cov_7.921730:996-3482(+)